jgi:hypothetical protein
LGLVLPDTAKRSVVSSKVVFAVAALVFVVQARRLSGVILLVFVEPKPAFVD